jgi:hypothetical protein
MSFPIQEMNHNCLVGQPIAYLLHQSIFSEAGTVNLDVSYGFVIELDAMFGLCVVWLPLCFDLLVWYLLCFQRILAGI